MPFRGIHRLGVLVAACLSAATAALAYAPRPDAVGVDAHAFLPDAGPNGEDVAAPVESRAFEVPQRNQDFAHDADGNLVADGRFAYAWDAESRLVLASNDAVAVSFAYDHRGRRIGRKQYTWDTDHWSLVTDHFFLYDGWHLVAEYTHTPTLPNSHTNYYTWGLDLSGSLQGAGGVGGLLAVTTSAANPSNLPPCNPATFFPVFDANGNVTDYVGTNGEAAASFEYSPFGEVVAETVAPGLDPAAFAFRFSTKPFDPILGLYDFGLRWYCASTGRWLSRDPIAEAGGWNLYAFCGNDGVNAFDPFGLNENSKIINSITLNLATGNTQSGSDVAVFNSWNTSCPDHVYSINGFEGSIDAFVHARWIFSNAMAAPIVLVGLEYNANLDYYGVPALGGYWGGWYNPFNWRRALYTGDPRTTDAIYQDSIDAAGSALIETYPGGGIALGLSVQGGGGVGVQAGAGLLLVLNWTDIIQIGAYGTAGGGSFVGAGGSGTVDLSILPYTDIEHFQGEAAVFGGSYTVPVAGTSFGFEEGVPIQGGRDFTTLSFGWGSGTTAEAHVFYTLTTVLRIFH